LADGKTAGGRLGTSLLDHLDVAEVNLGDFEAARTRYAERERSLLERGLTMFVYTIAMNSAYLEELAGEHQASERILRRAWQGLAAAGEDGFRSQIGAMLAGSLANQRRLDEAEQVLDEADGITAGDDVSSRGENASVRCLIYSRQGRHEEAVRAGEAAVRITDGMDYTDLRTQARLALGEALFGAGRPAEARETLLAARDHAREKGSTVLEARIVSLLEEHTARATGAQPA
jgi:tetratricopeptide (TPR) repeat protein